MCPAALENPNPIRGSYTDESDTALFDYMTMLYTVEELRRDWHIVGRDLNAATDLQAVTQASHRPGMYRIAAEAEPERHYFWLAPSGRLEAMDH